MLSHSPEETFEFAGEIADKLKDRDVIALYGELGSGKTHFVKGLCNALKINEEVSSPTFILVNEYSSKRFKKIFHFDFYRLNNEDELRDIGFEEYLNEGNLILIEWPKLAERFLPDNTIRIYFSHTFKAQNEREIETELK